MATSSTTSITSILPINTSCNLRTLHNDGQCSFLRRRTDFHRFGSKTPPNKNLIVRRASPEVAGDLLSSSFSLPAVPGLDLVGDTPWLAAAAGLFVGLPLMVQRLVTFTKELDAASQTVENIADAVEKVAKQVDKAAEEFGDALPEGGLKKFMDVIEEAAEETAEGAQKVEDMMDKVQELDDKLEAFLKKEKGTGQA